MAQVYERYVKRIFRTIIKKECPNCGNPELETWKGVNGDIVESCLKCKNTEIRKEA